MLISQASLQWQKRCSPTQEQGCHGVIRSNLSYWLPGCSRGVPHSSGGAVARGSKPVVSILRTFFSSCTGSIRSRGWRTPDHSNALRIGKGDSERIGKGNCRSHLHWQLSCKPCVYTVHTHMYMYTSASIYIYICMYTHENYLLFQTLHIYILTRTGVGRRKRQTSKRSLWRNKFHCFLSCK